ncbi:MAG: hypothetical protein QOJ06_2284 [Pseudonocardiales bacterium]|nr:hypothetical protein [Pseudonocardiales bacterium]
MRMHPRKRYHRDFGRPFIRSAVARSSVPHRRRQGTSTIFERLPHAHPHDPVAVLLDSILMFRSAGFEIREPKSVTPPRRTDARSQQVSAPRPVDRTRTEEPVITAILRDTVEGLNRRTSCIHRT